MIHKGVSRTFFLYAYNISDGTPKTGDASNITVYKAEDTGTATQITDTITEIDATNMPGWYRLTTTLNGNSVAISSRSSTSGVAVTLAGAYLNTGAIPAVDAGANGGIPIIGSDPLTKLDVNVSTRLAAADYTAPDNTSIAAIKSKTDKLTFDTNNYVYAIATNAITDWTDNEKKQIRYRLGIDGTTQAPSTNAPHLGNTYSTLDDLASHVSTRLAASDYEAPDNASISAIKTQTDKLQFDSNNYVYAVGIGGGGGVQVVVQPLTASVQRTDGAGGVISGWTYARLVASWNVKDVDLSGHDLRLLLYNRNDPGSAIVEYSTGAGEITITYNNPDSLVEVDGPDSKTPNAGNYAYVLRDQTTDTVLLSGNCLIWAAPDAG